LLMMLLGVAGWPSARADTIWISTGGGGKSVGNPNIKVNDGHDGKLFFRAASGLESSRDFSQITRIQLSDEPALGTGEEAFADQKWDVATEAFQKTLKTTGKDWLKEWTARRLLESAQKANRFDEAVDAYIALV